MASDERELLLHVCAAPADRAWVEGYLLPSLALAKGEVHTRDDDRPGRARVSEIAEATTRARYTLLVLSQAFLADRLGDYTASLASHAAVHEGRLLLVSREACPLPLQLDYLVRLECHEGDEVERWGAEMARLRALLDRPEPAGEELPCPYPGLPAYTAKEASRFYGRDKEAARLLQRLWAGEQEIYVIGPSGSGKSSLIQAGVLPKVEGRAASPYFDAPFVVRAMRPTERPTERLVQALGAGPPRSRRGVDASPPASARGTLAAAPPAPEPFDPASLGPAIDALLAAHSGAGRVLLFVDQLEELFTLAELAERRRFFEALRALRSLPRCSMLLAMRGDFSDALIDSDLWPDLEDRFDPLRVAPLRGQALAKAIEAPARALGVAFEPRLAERLVADAADEPGALPLLQTTLRELWGKLARRLVCLRDYEALGEEGKSRLASALTSHANKVLGTLSVTERLVARRMFVRLISFGEGRSNTRRQQTKAALLELGESEAQAARVLDRLISERLLTASDDERDGGADRDPRGARIDLAHEALIEGWPTLARWLGELQGAEQTRQRLEAKVDEWRRLGRGRGGLLDAEELPEFDAWQKSEVAAELGIDRDLPTLVKRSREALKRQKRVRTTIASLIALLVWVLGVVALLLQQRSHNDAHLQQGARPGEALVAAISAAEDITLSLGHDLQTNASASAVRNKLLHRSNELVARLESLADELPGEARQIRTVILQQKADLLLEQGKLPEALTLYQQAHANFMRQAEAAPIDPALQNGLSISYGKLCGVLKEAGRLDEATRACRAGLAIAQKVAEGPLYIAQWQRDLSDSHGRLGDVLRAAGKLDEARGAFEKSLAIRQKLANKDRSNALWRRDLAQAHTRLLDVSASQQRRDEAQVHYREAVAQMDALEREGLLREDAQMPKIRAWLEALRREHRLAATP
ncbi:MAG TPA: AAA family ATPase [Polyangiaceae bacterium]|nr:AAA family ATPase [Polyangiaceae bacterium]